MKVKTVWVFLLGVTLAGFATAQTKLSGELKCDKASKLEKIDAGDREGHALTLSETKCTWTKPAKLGDTETKDGVSVATGDADAAKSTEKGYHHGTMANGDKIYVRYEGAAMMKDGKPASITGTYRFAGGTGKMKNLKGGGTYKGTPAADGTVTFAIRGSYTLGGT